MLGRLRLADVVGLELFQENLAVRTLREEAVGREHGQLREIMHREAG